MQGMMQDASESGVVNQAIFFILAKLLNSVRRFNDH